MARTKRSAPKKQPRKPAKKSGLDKAKAKTAAARAKLRKAEKAAADAREAERAARQQDRLDRAKTAKHRAELAAAAAKRKREKARRQRERETKSHAKQLQGVALLSPGKLTPSRKRKAKTLWKMFGDFFNPEHYVFKPIAKKHRTKVKRLAEAGGLGKNVTPSHIAIPREGFRKNVRLEVNDAGFRIRRFKFKEATIARRKKKGQIFGRLDEEVIPLFEPGEHQDARDRLRREAQDLPLGDGQSLAFKTNFRGREGHSHAIYSDIEQIIYKVENYYRIKDEGTKTEFFNQMSLVRTGPEWIVEGQRMRAEKQKANQKKQNDARRAHRAMVRRIKRGFF